MKRPFVLALTLLASVARIAVAQNDDDAMRSLEGLRHVGVVIERVGSEAILSGVDTGQVRSSLELALRRAGLHVDESSTPFVHLSLTFLPAVGGFVYSYALEVKQIATLGDGNRVFVSTWRDAGVGTSPSSTLGKDVLDTVAGLVSAFLNDWGNANPRS